MRNNEIIQLEILFCFNFFYFATNFPQELDDAFLESLPEEVREDLYKKLKLKMKLVTFNIEGHQRLFRSQKKIQIDLV